MVVGGDEPLPGGRVDDRLVDRVEAEERVAREVHLRDQTLRERGAEEREVDVGRPPGVAVVLPRVGAGLDGGEPVLAVVAGDDATDAGEVRVERRGVLVALVHVAARRVRLPDLDELAAHGAAVAVEHPARHDDALAERIARVLDRQVGLLGRDIRVTECR
jgi:hypothetical protein